MPFLISILLVSVGLFIRLSLTETPVFRAVQAKHEVAKLPILEVFGKHRKALLIAVALPVSEISFSIVTTVFSLSYITGQFGIARSLLLDGVLLAAIVQLFTLPAFGWLSDRFGRRPLFLAGCLFVMLFAFPLFWLFDTRDPKVIVATITIAVGIGQSLMYGPEATWVAELFASRLRYSGASVGLQMGAALSGGLTPIVVAFLFAWSGATWLISLYLIAFAVATLAATLAAPETAGRALE